MTTKKTLLIENLAAGELPYTYFGDSYVLPEGRHEITEALHHGKVFVSDEARFEYCQNVAINLAGKFAGRGVCLVTEYPEGAPERDAAVAERLEGKALPDVVTFIRYDGDRPLTYSWHGDSYELPTGRHEITAVLPGRVAEGLSVHEDCLLIARSLLERFGNVGVSLEEERQTASQREVLPGETVVADVEPLVGGLTEKERAVLAGPRPPGTEVGFVAGTYADPRYAEGRYPLGETGAHIRTASGDHSDSPERIEPGPPLPVTPPVVVLPAESAPPVSVLDGDPTTPPEPTGPGAAVAYGQGGAEADREAADAAFPVDPTSGTVDEVKARIAAMTTKAELRAAQRAEEKDKNRTGVLDAIARRREQLENE